MALPQETQQRPRRAWPRADQRSLLEQKRCFFIQNLRTGISTFLFYYLFMYSYFPREHCLFMFCLLQLRAKPLLAGRKHGSIRRCASRLGPDRLAIHKRHLFIELCFFVTVKVLKGTALGRCWSPAHACEGHAPPCLPRGRCVMSGPRASPIRRPQTCGGRPCEGGRKSDCGACQDPSGELLLRAQDGAGPQ